jgi:actin, other eukaryote
MVRLLMDHGYSFSSTCGREIVRDMKEKFGYVTLDFEKELTIRDNRAKEKYKLPDSQMISIDSERFKCPELLFNPQIGGHECVSISQLLHSTIMKCDMDIRKYLFNNCILSGGDADVRN